MEHLRFNRSLKRSGAELAPRIPTTTVSNPAASTLRRRLTPMLAVLLLIVPGCKPDTCSGGENMTDPRVVGDFSTASITPTLVIEWDAGTGVGALLPDEYFEDVLDWWSDDGVLIESVSYTGERELTVVFSSLEASLAERDALSFTLWFPDRADHTNCTHGGMMDIYLLDVTLLLDEGGTLESAEFTQNVQYGAY